MNTWISTAEAVITNGLKIVFCDINLNDYSICLDDLKKKINKKTKLIMPVHLYGNPSDLPKIKKIVQKKKLASSRIVRKLMVQKFTINMLVLLGMWELLVFSLVKILEHLEMQVL